MKKYLVLTSFANRLTGANLVTFAFIKALKQYGCTVYLASIDYPNYRILERFYGDLFEKPDKHVFDISLIDVLGLVIHKKDIVTVNTHAETLAYPLQVNYYHDKPLGTVEAESKAVTTIAESISDIVNAQAVLNFANSFRTLTELEKYGIPSFVLYPPVPKPPVEVKDAEKEDAVGYFGRIVSNKNIELMLYIAEQMPDVKVVIAGKPSPVYLAKLKKEVEERGLKNVEIIGKTLSIEEKAEVLSKLKVLVHTRPNEPFGIAPLEGVYYGAVPLLPCTAGAYEILNGYVPCWKGREDVVKVLREVLRDYKYYLLQSKVNVENKASFEAFRERLYEKLEEYKLL